MKTNILSLCTLLMLLPVLCLAEEKPQQEKTAATQPADIKTTAINKTDYAKLSATLLSISELKNRLEQQIELTGKIPRKATADSEREQELKRLGDKLTQTTLDFEKIATGVDTSKFQAPEETPFDWKAELFSLMRPGIMELKRLTVEARKKSELLNRQDSYQELLPIAQQADNNLKDLVKNIDNPALKNFFRTRGLYIAVAIAACCTIVILLRLIHLLIRKTVPGNRKEYRPVHIRIIDLVFQILTVVCALFSFVLVFYFFEDWLLLSFSILFLAGLGWTTKTFLPKFWQQSQMMLNFGNVREGERLVLYGVPWLVKSINLRTRLENPTLAMTITVPINDLLDKTSRTFHRKEPWFPCRKDDWVILADGTRGCAVSVSHEQVELVLRGGACKTYQTSHFLGLSPLNLSRNFRIKEIFGIGYCHQAESTGSVLQTLEAYLLAQIEKEGYAKELLNLRVEFQSAGASSLDIVVIADFKGSQAPIYNRLRRAIQRWCVDACTENNWTEGFCRLAAGDRQNPLDCTAGNTHLYSGLFLT